MQTKEMENLKDKFTIHNHGRYRLIKNGSKRFPWNVYRMPSSPKGEWEFVGYETKKRLCEEKIDKGVYDKVKAKNANTVVLDNKESEE